MAFLFGSGPKTQTLPRYTPQQTNLANMLGGNAQGLLSNLMANANQSSFAPIAQKARTQFNQQTVPSIAERFTSMGKGAQSSPAFANLLGQAGANLEEGLAAQEAQFGLQQRGLDQSLLGLLLGGALQPQFENLYQPSQPGFLQSILPALGSIAGSFAPLPGGTAAGGAAGGGIAALLAKLFGGGGGGGSTSTSTDALGRQSTTPSVYTQQASPMGMNALDYSLFNNSQQFGNVQNSPPVTTNAWYPSLRNKLQR